jgi:hypothetical protein
MNEREELAKKLIEEGKRLGKSREEIKVALDKMLADYDSQSTPSRPIQNIRPEERLGEVRQEQPQTQGFVEKTSDFLTQEPTGFWQSLAQGVTKAPSKVADATGKLLTSGARSEVMEQGLKQQQFQTELRYKLMREARERGDEQEVERLQKLIASDTKTDIDYGQQAKEMEGELRQSRSDYLTGLVGTGMLILGGSLAGAKGAATLSSTLGKAGVQGAVHSIGRTKEDIFTEEGFKKAAGQAVVDAGIAAAIAGVFYGLDKAMQDKVSKNLSKEEMKAIKDQKPLIDKLKDPDAKLSMNEQLTLAKTKAKTHDWSIAEKAEAGYLKKGLTGDTIELPEVEMSRKALGIKGNNYKTLYENADNIKNQVNKSIATALKSKKGAINLTNEASALGDTAEDFARNGVSVKALENTLKEFGIVKGGGDVILSPAQAHALATKIGKIASNLPKDSMAKTPLFQIKSQISGKYMPLVKGTEILQNADKNVLNRSSTSVVEGLKSLTPDNNNYLLTQLYRLMDLTDEAFSSSGVPSLKVPIISDLSSSLGSPLAMGSGTVSKGASQTAGYFLRDFPKELASEGRGIMSDIAGGGDLVKQGVQSLVQQGQRLAPVAPVRFIIEQLNK